MKNCKTNEEQVIGGQDTVINDPSPQKRKSPIEKVNKDYNNGKINLHCQNQMASIYKMEENIHRNIEFRNVTPKFTNKLSLSIYYKNQKVMKPIHSEQ